MNNHVADYAVIGLGLMGSAALRYLSADGAQVIGIGPAEPSKWRAHDGVFASHYDQGRITRVLDPDLEWAEWAETSIAEYAKLESASGIKFHEAVGCLRVSVDPDTPDDPGSPPDTLNAAEQTGLMRGADFTRLDSQGLQSQFPFLHFPTGAVGLAERGGAGYVNPRAMARAQLIVAANQGATVIRETAISVAQSKQGVQIVTDAGSSYVARRVLIAAGAWTNRLLAKPFKVNILARTVLLGSVDMDEATRLHRMPAIIAGLKDHAYFSSFYCLPPILYPDGNYYLKIGGTDCTPMILAQDEITDWFHGQGNADAGAALQEIMRSMVLGMQVDTWHTAPCVYTETPTGRPIWERVAPNIAVVMGGNGSGAKSANEIGRRGAQMVMEL